MCVYCTTYTSISIGIRNLKIELKLNSLYFVVVIWLVQLYSNGIRHAFYMCITIKRNENETTSTWLTGIKLLRTNFSSFFLLSLCFCHAICLKYNLYRLRCFVCNGIFLYFILFSISQELTAMNHKIQEMKEETTNNEKKKQKKITKEWSTYQNKTLTHTNSQENYNVISINTIIITNQWTVINRPQNFSLVYCKHFIFF